MKLSQKERIKMKLELEGYISRNECIHSYLTFRLAARIDDLRKEGYEFEVEEDGKDCVYRLKNKPEKQLVLLQ